jgi:peptide/nickel transport system permease protein
MLVALIAAALLAPWLTPQNPFDLASVELADAERPPAWMDASDSRFPLGTDGQGRDILSLILYGARISLAVGSLSVLVALAIGVPAGLTSGYLGGAVDAVLMRLADIQLSFPVLLLALTLDGIATGLVPPERREAMMIPILSLSIGLSQWVLFARALRSSTLAERQKEYIQAARLIGVGRLTILFRHLLPNALTPLYALTTVQFATAVLTESTLSFLGVGLPPTAPSLGTLIRTGGDFLFSGQWWLTAFPGLMLVLLALSINLVGDGLRQALDPRTRGMASS